VSELRKRIAKQALVVLLVGWAVSLVILANASEVDHAEDAHGSSHAVVEEVVDSHDDGHAVEAAHGAAGEHDAHHEPHYHILSILDIIVKQLPAKSQATVGKTLEMFQPTIFGLILTIAFAIVMRTATRNMTLVPGKLQNVVELIVGGLYDFLAAIVGERGKHLVPFLGTLFLYIWLMNFMGLVPFLMSPTSHFRMTVALAITVFLYVQWTGVKQNGIGGFIHHLCGSPRDAIGWSLTPLMLPLHIIGELARPLSLSLRLFGNVFGEDKLIAVFATLGAMALAFSHIPIGIPFQVPFVFLALLTGTIQALVFTLLSTIYFALALPHEEH